MQKVLIQFVVLVAAVVGLSFVSSRLWGGRPEGQIESRPLAIADGMTVAQFGRRNELRHVHGDLSRRSDLVPGGQTEQTARGQVRPGCHSGRNAGTQKEA